MIWEPKPLRPMYNLPVNEEYRIKKDLTPMERQRRSDGSPITVSRPYDLKPADPKIYLGKGSLAEKLPPATSQTNTDPPQFCEHSFSELVKSYLNSDK
jgi:hypothetical protein